MQIRVAALSALFALASIGSVLAQTSGPQLSVSGTVVSTGNTSMVVKIDDHGHKIPFLIGATTLVPAGLEVGSRVAVAYHPIGATNQMADSVTLLGSAPAEPRRIADASQPAQSSGTPPATSTPQAEPTRSPEQQPAAPQSPSAAEPAELLPATASLLPLVGLIGLIALLGSASLRALERRRS